LLVDTHAHLDMEQFDGDRAQALQRASEAGVEWLVDVGADLAGSRRAVDLAGNEPRIWAAVGIHPHDAATLTPEALAELTDLAQRPRVVAIGEIGLDYYRDLSPRTLQQEAFATQLDLARRLHLPVIVHNRDAHADTLSLLRAAGGGLRGVMHCFSGDLELARQVLDLGLHLGLAGPLTYPKATCLAEVARWAPMDRLLVETDCPYLAPQPCRGRRNEPAYVRWVAERLAELRGCPFTVVAQATSANAAALFAVEP
jgi:TatD DNase family protein